MCDSAWSRSRTSRPRPASGPSAGSSGSRSTNMRSISSSTVAVSSERFSVLGSSGAKSGSAGSEPRHECSRPVTVPRSRARGTNPSRSARHSPQPSCAPCRYSCSVPRVASTSRPAYSYQPASGAMCSNPRAERKRSSSSSGLTPGSSRRKTLRISSSPKTTDELDCSTPTGRTSTVPPKPAAALSAQRKRMLPCSAATSAEPRIRCSSSRPCAGSASASYTVQPSTSAIARSAQRSAAGRRPSGTW